jgi:hypothetical protein
MFVAVHLVCLDEAKVILTEDFEAALEEEKADCLLFVTLDVSSYPKSIAEPCFAVFSKSVLLPCTVASIQQTGPEIAGLASCTA